MSFCCLFKHNLLLALLIPMVVSGITLPPPAASPYGQFTPEFINATLINITNKLSDDFSRKYGYCFTNGERDVFSAFSTSDLSHCPVDGDDDPSTRLCSRAEIRIYFDSIFAYITPSSPNCNATNWWRACEPGWCSNVKADTKLPSDFNSASYIPVRNVNPQPCCLGFFCPRGMSCMIPCPLGSYCPPSGYNEYWKTCEPYGYQLTPGVQNNSCGGAHLWADYSSSGRIFCSAGFYCPNATLMLPCEKGHFCRLGSTSPTKCLPFISCDSQAEDQNMQVYGIMLITMLVAVLAITYGCSDKFLIIQEQRRSKARGQARDYSTSSDRWTKTKEAAKRLSVRISRTFSEAKLSTSAEELQTLVAAPQEALTAESVSSDIDSNTTHQRPILSPPTPAEAKYDPFHLQNPRTQSQIFKYAYGQIEREKHLDSSQQGLLTSRPRLRIEIAFEDLTMILKKNGKKILSNVTGKLLPGHITAVMGPSGAGKTTFLNAVAGKAIQSNTTGHVRINGKRGSIQSYKKIIGFVPQDDIVHGTLTVEENLCFSAKYRLPTDLPKSERVLVIERIIDALGLDPLRDSLVGTVERRGISGGQRKRVNVGLEMVMEPSLLILDEPTSGLDSTSSRLVLQALRREATAGVNVVVVLHQPNYGLFKMFDDVMFLARGGRVAYLGPVEKVEDYFQQLGFPVPARVNPPDHFMDVLEGLVKREGDTNFDPQMLPIIWMQHNGYRITEDLQSAAAQLLGESSNRLQPKKLSRSKTLSQEAWEEVKDPLVVWWDGLKSVFLTVEDLSGRKTPGFIKQFFIIFERIWKQRLQEVRVLAQDYIILLLCGICLGLLSDVRDITLGSNAYTNTIIALSLLCMIAALRTFSLDKLQFWRESASGINRVAYFLAKDTLDHFNTLVKPLVYLSMFYFFNDPRSTFLSNFLVTAALVYCVTGVSYIFSITLHSSTAQLVSVFFPILQTLIAGKKRTSALMRFLMTITYTKWAFEAYIISNAARYSGVWLITRCGLLSKLGYRLDNINLCIIILFLYGLGARVIALICLLLCNRSRQQ